MRALLRLAIERYGAFAHARYCHAPCIYFRHAVVTTLFVALATPYFCYAAYDAIACRYAIWPLLICHITLRHAMLLPLLIFDFQRDSHMLARVTLRRYAICCRFAMPFAAYAVMPLR